MRPIRYLYSPTALDRDGLALSQTPAGAGAFTLNGALIVGGLLAVGAPQFLTAYSASNISARTITFTGVNGNGLAISETITGPNNSTVSTTKSFASGSVSAEISGAAAGAIELGVSGLGNGNPIPLDHTKQTPFDMSVAVTLPDGAGPTWTFQHTFDDVQAVGYDPEASTSTWFDHDDSNMVAQTVKRNGNIVVPVTAVRTQKTAGTGGLRTTIIQQGI